MLPVSIDSTPPAPPAVPALPAPSLADRATAALEVIACSGYPTQLALLTFFQALGLRAITPGGGLNMTFVVAVSLIDSVLLVALIIGFLHSHGERPRDVFLGSRSTVVEAKLGIPMVLGALLITFAVLQSVQVFAPWMHNVAENPLGTLIRSPRDAWIFALLVVVAGGIREELQRAFMLHRFEGWLGGGIVGVVATSASFGAGHAIQGIDAMIATGLLGAFWAVIYLRRRSVIGPIVSHAGFDLLQVVAFLYSTRSIGQT